MSIFERFSEQIFTAITRFPIWLESFDALEISGWAVILTIGLTTVGLVFAIREFLSWFLKTNAIVDEVIRLENLVRDLKGDLAALEGTLRRLQKTAGAPETESPTEPALVEKPPAGPSFRHH